MSKNTSQPTETNPVLPAMNDEAESEARYRGLFENSPISLWEEDFSKIKEYLDDLLDSGVTDLRVHFDEHPESVTHCASLARVIDVNQATLDLFKAQTTEELLGGLGTVFTDDSYEVFQEELIALAKGATEFKSEAVHRTLMEEDVYVAINLAVAPGYETSWSRVFVSIIDITERKQVEEALRESEEKYRNVVERANDGVAIVQDQIIKFANPRLAELQGHPLSDVVGAPFAKYIDPDELPKVTEYYRRRLAGEDVVQVYETILRNKDGSKVCAEVNAGLINYQGRPASLIIVRDITERKLAMEALTHEHDLLQALMNNIPDGIYFKDTRFRFTRINQAQAQVLGFDDPSDALGKTDLDFFVEEHALAAHQDEQQIIDSRVPVIDKVEKLTTLDGRVTWASATKVPILDQDGTVIGIVGISRDITERKEAEETLRKSEERYRALFERTNDAIFIMSLDGIYLTVNQQAADMLGYRVDEIEGLSVQDIVAPHEYLDSQVSLQTILSGEPLPVYERRLRHKDGTEVPVEINVALVYDEDENPLHIQSIVRDITERKRAEEALRRSEERFRSVFENAVMGLYRTTPSGRILLANPALLQMLGYSSFEELAGRNLEKNGFAAQYPRAVFKEQIETQGQIVGLESSWVKADGTTLFVRESARAICDESGEVLYYEGTVEDITERKQTEEALQESEERYRLLFETSPESVTLVGLDGIVIDCYNATSEISGLVREEMIGRSYMDFETVNQDDLPKYAEFFLQLVNGEKVAPFELVIQRGNEPCWIEVFPALLKKDEVPHAIQIISRDITEQKLAQAERDRLLQDLVRRSTQLVAASEVSKSASTILNPSDLIERAVNVIQTRFNFYYVGLFLMDRNSEYAVLRAGTGDAGCRMLIEEHKLRISGESMIGQCVATAQARIALDVGAEAVRFDNPHLPDTRSEMALPLISRGQCTGALTVQSIQEAAFSPGDITTLQTMADQLAIAIANARFYDQVQRYATKLEDLVVERTTELATVNRELESFSYSVSHDLRAPLRSIDGFSQALLEDYDDQLDAVGQDYLQRVRAASQRMSRLIDDLLTLSRMTRREMSREQIHLSALVRTITVELQQHEPERQIALIVAEDVFATGDPQLVQVVLENLLGNAWKFTSKHPQAKIEFGSFEYNGEQVYFVRDDGAGFDMAYAHKLFGAFQRLHGMTEFEGTGIGLATVQRIIHRHNGRIWAEAEVEKGATFYFTLQQQITSAG